MKHAASILSGALLGLVLANALPVDAQTAPTPDTAPMELKMAEADLRANGAFGFPQKGATVLCNNSDLRVSVWNNQEYLYVEAIVWNDNNAALGKTDDGRAIGDTSFLMVRVDPSGKLTPKVDRDYALNPWPEMTGLHYVICLSKGSTTHILSDSSGRGAIRYVQTPEGRKIRVDVYLIPLTEISKHVSDTVRLCYYGDSPLPVLTVNSAGYSRGGKHYYSFQIPGTNYQSYVLAPGSDLALDGVPDGHNDPSMTAPRHRQPMPQTGSMAPEIAAKDWLNTPNPPTLAGLRGKTILVEFWATWCGPCIESIPHLNELQKKYAGDGFTILSFTEQDRQGIENFLKRTPMDYTIGLESDDTFDRYGITGIPQAFLLDHSGKIVWEGNSGDKALESEIQKALKGG